MGSYSKRHRIALQMVIQPYLSVCKKSVSAAEFFFLQPSKRNIAFFHFKVHVLLTNGGFSQ
jgi:hypothetical protein